MAFQTYVDARDSVLRNAERQRAEQMQMQDRNAMVAAGQSIAGGDYAGGQNALLNAGMIGDAMGVQRHQAQQQQTQMREQEQMRERQRGALVEGATALRYLPADQRWAAYQSRVLPTLRQAGIGDDILGQINDQVMSDSELDMVIAMAGGEVQRPTAFNTAQGIIERDPYSGAYSQGYAIERQPPAPPPGYRQTASGDLEYIPGGPADPRQAGGLAASRRAPKTGGRSSGQASSGGVSRGASALPPGFTIRGR